MSSFGHAFVDQNISLPLGDIPFTFFVSPKKKKDVTVKPLLFLNVIELFLWRLCSDPLVSQSWEGERSLISASFSPDNPPSPPKSGDSSV